MLSHRQRKQRIGRAIRKNRLHAGFSQKTVAEELGGGQTTFSAYENGKNAPSVEILDQLDELFSTGHALVKLWQSLNQESDGYASWFAGVVEVERESVEIREYAPLHVPGLLQTEGYARAILSYGSAAPEEVANHLQGRSARQDLLKAESGPTLQFVVEEHVLRRPLGGRAVLEEQLARILEISALPRVSVQVISMDSEEHPGIDGGFVLYRHPERGPISYTETRYMSYPTEDTEVYDGYMSVWADLRGAALPAPASAKLIREIQKGGDQG